MTALQEDRVAGQAPGRWAGCCPTVPNIRPRYVTDPWQVCSCVCLSRPVAWVVTGEQTNTSALCVGRHPYLSDHLARYFGNLGLTTRAVTGLEAAVAATRESAADVVICDYDLLATLSLECWEKDELLSRTAVIAVSLSRRPAETHLLDVNGIAGFLYLPSLDQQKALRMFKSAVASSRSCYSPAPATTSPSDESISQHPESLVGIPAS